MLGTVSRPITVWARWMATRGSKRRRLVQRLDRQVGAGAMTLPSKSPFSATMSKLVAVPKSTTMTAPL